MRNDKLAGSLNNMTETITNESKTVGVWQPVLFAALAGGMAWGIRGQYGHETGAMIAGLLVSLTLTFLLCPKAPSFQVVRAVAMGTVAMGFGGSMTYGQTVGLTHNPETVGHYDALAWGMLGLAIKGAIWIGFAGTFLGMGLGGKRYESREIFVLFLTMVGAFFIGTRLLNYPIDVEARELPILYFSEHVWWEATGEFDPRRESWGGLLFALIVAITFASRWRDDKLARNLGLWGIVGGAIGFPLGQSIQAFHAWHPELFTEGIWERLAPSMNWWNWMETTFGATMGAALGLGLWLNRKRIAFEPDALDRRLSPITEIVLLALHIVLLFLVEFRSFRNVDALYDLGIIMGIIPMACIVGGRWWPYFAIFPVTVMPIAGKTFKNLVLEPHQYPFAEFALEVAKGNRSLLELDRAIAIGGIIYFVIPMVIATAAAIYFALTAVKGESRRQFTLPAVLLASWMFFSLNFAFFRFPWPWETWTGRTPNGIMFTICVLGLTAMALSRLIALPNKSSATP